MALTPPPLCIIQARYNSTRLPGKMLLKLGGETLIERAHRMARDIFGRAHVIVAIPMSDENGPLGQELDRIGALTISVDVPEADVLSRFYHAARTLRWMPESVIVRWCPDDPFKDAACVRRVIAGERLPVEQGAEAFTLGMLREASIRELHPHRREHLTYALFGVLPPPPPSGVWEINTRADYEAACAMLEQHVA
jgi:spore coat polysaccharide biosynthesis protein SpsF (cytidylyltransferase family)